MADTAYVLVCQNADCKARGSGTLFEELARRLAGRPDIEVKPYMCFGACQSGPNIVLYPQRVWYSAVKERDVEAIAAHAEGGQKVEQLAQGIDPSLQDLIYQLLDAGLF
jgi:(2Fe-2S) ferredoxin